jgi:hypothetical protein
MHTALAYFFIQKRAETKLVNRWIRVSLMRKRVINVHLLLLKIIQNDFLAVPGQRRLCVSAAGAFAGAANLEVAGFFLGFVCHTGLSQK